MTDYSVTDIKRLVNDGVWHLKEDAINELMAGEEVEVLGEVSFGHFSYDIIHLTDSPPINIELGIYKPCENDTDRDFADNPGFRSSTLTDFTRDVPDLYEWFSPLYLCSEITGSQDFKEKLVEAMVQEDILSVQKSLRSEYQYLKENEKGYYQQLGKHYRELVKKTIIKPKLTKQDVEELMVHYYNNYGKKGDTDKIILQMREDGLTDGRMAMVFDKMIEDKLVMPFDYKKDIKFYTDKKSFDPFKVLERAAKKQNVKE